MANPSGPLDRGTPPPGVGARPTRQDDPKTTTGSAGASTAAAGELSQQAHAAFDDIKNEARDAADDMKREVRDAAEYAKDQARAAADTQKDAAAERMGGFAHALNTASDDLREHGQAFAADYVQKAAGGLERVSDVMRERDVDELIGTVEDFARRQPVAFLGAAMVAGFGLARLMKSSADRRHDTHARTGPQGGGIHGNG